MGEWSDYFEDFPEENSANWIDGQFDPKGAEDRRYQEAAQNEHMKKVAQESAALRAKIQRKIDKHSTKPEQKGK